MARILDVYLHRELVGRLVQDDGGRMQFAYDAEWLDNPEAVALSHSLPLREEEFSQRECQGFFGGILPEEANREVIARNLGISARNDFAMLQEIGGECAGAVTFVPAGEALPEEGYAYRALDEAELARILEELPRRPLLAGEEGVRLSLAGAQDKLAVHVKDGVVSVPLGGAPSTHILKPAIARFEGLVFNEAYCMRLAAACGLPAAGVSTQSAGGVDYLLVERYDRIRNEGGEIARLHQEDFCQALGIPSDRKYQAEGGPGLKQCFDLARAASTTPVIDLQRLLDAVIFNYLIGNCDAHGKNFSLLYRGGAVRLAPLYDVLNTGFYPELSDRMAMHIGRERQFGNILPEHFEAMAEEAGLGAALVRRRVPELAEEVMAALDGVGQDDAVAMKLSGLMRQRCESVMVRFQKA